jgi:hypothetical protein
MEYAVWIICGLLLAICWLLFEIRYFLTEMTNTLKWLRNHGEAIESQTKFCRHQLETLTTSVDRFSQRDFNHNYAVLNKISFSVDRIAQKLGLHIDWFTGSNDVAPK